MFSFRVEYTIRILIELELRARAGIMGVPIVWFRDVCGGDSQGLSIVMRLLLKRDWVNYDKSTFLYSGNVNIEDVSLYEVCTQIEESVESLPKSIRSDKISMKLKSLFEGIKLSDMIL